jgi:hypothetical protein
VLSIASSGVTAQKGMTRINGTVTEDSGGNAIRGVVVQARFAGSSVFDTSTDDKGDWAIGGMGKGEWEIVFEKSGYQPRRVHLVLPVDLSRVPKITVTLKKGS